MTRVMGDRVNKKNKVLPVLAGNWLTEGYLEHLTVLLLNQSCPRFNTVLQKQAATIWLALKLT